MRRKVFTMRILKLLFLCLLLGGCSAPERLEMKESAVLIDVRSVDEYNSGFIPGAVNIPHGEIAEKIAAVAPDKATPLYLYCRSGRRVGIAMEKLKELGYTDMVNLGGFEEAKEKLGK